MRIRKQFVQLATRWYTRNGVLDRIAREGDVDMNAETLKRLYVELNDRIIEALNHRDPDAPELMSFLLWTTYAIEFVEHFQTKMFD